MITAICFLLIVATVPLAGGSLERLGEIRLRKWWTIVASLVLQIGVISVFPGELGPTLAGALHVFSYLLALAFVWFNRSLVGMVVIVAGGMMNLAAIAANDGVMPARLEALETAGIISDSATFENSAPVDDAALWFLGDVFAIPAGVPFANVFSIGDILLVLGGGITVHAATGSKLGRLFRREQAEDGADLVSIDASLDDLAAGSGAIVPARPAGAPAAVGPFGTASAPTPAPPNETVPAQAVPTETVPVHPAAPKPSPAPVASAGLDDLFAVDRLPVAGSERCS